MTLLEEHGVIADRLAKAHVHLGFLFAQEREAKVNTFLQATGSDRQRENQGSLAALDITSEIFKVKAEIAADTERRDDIRLRLAYSGTT